MIPIFDWTIILVIPAIILSIWAQNKVKSAYKKYSQIASSSGLTGEQVAKRILNQHGMQDVKVVPTRGVLSDHYDPRKRVVALSEHNFHKPSIAGMAVAAHEVGHAIQHHEGFAMLKFRNALASPVQFGSWMAFPLVLIGLFMASPAMLDAGIVLFSLVVLFHLVTLPVEFDASRRALAILRTDGYVPPQEAVGAKKVLDAAAWTYVAAATVAILNLVRLLILRDVMR
ncbi:MAG TPA: zinc metallopeptidase [Bacteroidetes bacterium]|nr:zinc metallopeptidase [Bacteroidota bacterium]HEX03635.1 zinc metallopeptidase [Bacteroidota bacterium]